MNRRVAVAALPLAIGIGACGTEPVGPEAPAFREQAPLNQRGRPHRGTGLALNNVVGGLPIIGNVQVSQIVLTEFSTFLGGLRVEGRITGTQINAPGLTITEDFTTDVLISSTGSGCQLVTIDLGPIGTDVFNIVGVDIPEASVSGRGTGPVGSVLCNLTRAVNSVGGGVIRGLVNALNALLR